MPGQAHMRRRRLPALAVILLVPLAIPALGGADPSQSASSLRALDAQLAAKQRSAVLGLYSLDQQLAGADARLAALRTQAVRLRGQERELRVELRLARGNSRIAERRLDERLRLLYEQGTVSPLEVVLGARSLDEALNELDTLTAAGKQDQTILDELRSARTHLASAGRGLAARQRAIEASVAAASETERSLAGARAQRGAYVASLASRRRLTQQQIAAVVARARSATLRSRTIENTAFVEASAPVAPAPAAAVPLAATAVPADGGRTITVVATGYSLSGTTATGLPVGWGVAAVDPSVIPLGTHLTVPGYGEAVAADTGGAVAGDTIDLWFPTAEQADAWGRRTVTIVLH